MSIALVLDEIAMLTLFMLMLPWMVLFPCKKITVVALFWGDNQKWSCRILTMSCSGRSAAMSVAMVNEMHEWVLDLLLLRVVLLESVNTSFLNPLLGDKKVGKKNEKIIPTKR